ncbi:unnamed protein product [Rhizophagus irregularis]|nr:unnamed protein product [Rhizophagus irregularis]
MKIETKLVTDKEGLRTLHTSVQSHGERVRNSYDNCEEANEEYQNLSSNKTNLRMIMMKVTRSSLKHATPFLYPKKMMIRDFFLRHILL